MNNRNQVARTPWLHLFVAGALMFIVAAILFPVIPQDNRCLSFRPRPCLSNLKNSALALRMYSSDWDERLPSSPPVDGWPTPVGTCRSTSTCGWTFAANSYIKNTQVLLCPEYAKRRQLVNAKNPNYWPTTFMLSSALVGAAEGEITDAAHKVMLYEVLPYHKDGDMRLAWKFDNNLEKPNEAIFIAGFADGHVKMLSPTSLVGPQTPCNRATRWNLNSGWNPNTPNCAAGSGNDSPLGKSGRQGVNF